MRLKFYGIAMRPPLKSPAPAVLPSDSARVEVAPGTSRDTGAGVEFDGVVPIHGQGKGEAQACISLEIVVLHAIGGRASTGVVRTVHAAPHPSTKVVDEMSLYSVEGGLLATLPTEKSSSVV